MNHELLFVFSGLRPHRDVCLRRIPPEVNVFPLLSLVPCRWALTGKMVAWPCVAAIPSDPTKCQSPSCPSSLPRHQISTRLIHTGVSKGGRERREKGGGWCVCVSRSQCTAVASILWCREHSRTPTVTWSI